MNKKTIVWILIGMLIIAGAGVYFGFLKSSPRLVDGKVKPAVTYQVGESPTDGVFYNNQLYSFQGYTAQELIFDRIHLESKTNDPIQLAYPMESGRLNTVLPPDLVIAGDLMYVMLHVQQMVLIYNLEGELLKHWQVSKITPTSELAVGPERIYLLVPQKRTVLILDSAGTEQGRIPVDKGSVRLIVDDHVHVGNLLGFIVTYSATGEELTRTDLNIRYMYNFTLNEERIYAAYTDDIEGKNHLQVFDRAGKKRKTYALPYILTGLQEYQGKLYLSDENRQEVLMYQLK